MRKYRSLYEGSALTAQQILPRDTTPSLPRRLMANLLDQTPREQVLDVNHLVEKNKKPCSLT